MATSNSANFKYVYSDGADTFDYGKFFKDNFQKTDDLMFNGSQYIKTLPNPAVPTITTVGVAGTTTYSYYIVAVDKTGKKTLPSPVSTITTGNSVLSSTNYNTITWSAIAGAVSYDILKGDTGHSIATGVTGTTLNDTGQATSVYTAPTRNATGDLTVDGNIIQTNGAGWTNIPLANGWTVDSGRGIAQYRRDALGMVWMRGAIRAGTLNSSAVPFTFIGITGCRPSQIVDFAPKAIDGSGNLTTTTVQINTVGDAHILNNYSIQSITLDSMFFLGES